MNQKPLVSIVIPVYNGSNFLKDAIDSAIAQTYPNIEILVVNDGSSDGGATEGIALSYGDKIRYFRKENGGVASALNLGLDKMKGEYFAWLSHDDMYAQDKVSLQMEYFDKHQDAGVVAGGWTNVDEKGNLIEVVNWTDRFPAEQLARPLFPLFYGCTNFCSFLVKKSEFDRVGKFDETLRYTQDVDMCFRLMRKRYICFLGSTSIKRYHHIQGQKIYRDKVLEENDRYFTKAIKSLSDEEMCAMSDTVFNFYLSICRIFQSVYPDTVAYCGREAKRIAKTRKEKQELINICFLSRYAELARKAGKHRIERFVLSLQANGLKVTFYKVYRALCRCAIK